MADIKEEAAFLGDPEEKVWVTSAYSKKKQVFFQPCLEWAINMGYAITTGAYRRCYVIGVCSPVFLSGGQQNVNPRSIICGQVD